MPYTAPNNARATAYLVTAANWNELASDILESMVAKVTAAGDIAQATAANALARLAIGTPFRAPRVNAAATALEYGATFSAFLAYNSVDDVNQTGNGAVATVDFNTEVIDQAADFASDAFTCRVTNPHVLSMHVQVASIPAGATSMSFTITTSNRTYRKAIAMVAGTFGTFTASLSHLVDMDAGDTATVTVAISGGAGNTATISGDSDLRTAFSGFIVA